MLDAVFFFPSLRRKQSFAKSSFREVFVLRGKPGNAKSLSHRIFLGMTGSDESGNPNLEYLEVFEINIPLVSFRKKKKSVQTVGLDRTVFESQSYNFIYFFSIMSRVFYHFTQVK